MARQSSQSDHTHPSVPSQGHPATNQPLSNPPEPGANRIQGAIPSPSPVPSEEGASVGGRSPILPPLPKQHTTVPTFQPIGPLTMIETGGTFSAASAPPSLSSRSILSTSDSVTHLGEDRRREAILELQETLKQDLENTIFDQADLEELPSEAHSAPLASDAALLAPAIATPETAEEEEEQDRGVKVEPEQMAQRRRRRKRKSR